MNAGERAWIYRLIQGLCIRFTQQRLLWQVNICRKLGPLGSLSTCLSTCLSRRYLCRSVDLCAILHACPKDVCSLSAVCLSVYLRGYLSANISRCVPICLPVGLTVFVFCNRRCVKLSVCMSLSCVCLCAFVHLPMSCARRLARLYFILIQGTVGAAAAASAVPGCFSDVVVRYVVVD